MQIKYLIAFILWYGSISIVYTAVPDEILSGAAIDYDFVNDTNSSGFSASEIDSGGFFSGIIGVTTAVVRFIGFVFFGIGCCGSGTPTWFTILFIFWNTIVSMMFIVFIINAFWNP